MSQKPITNCGLDMTGRPLKTTIKTYDQIAEQYYQRWQDRTPIESHIERFIGMLRAYDLDSMPILDIGCGPGFDGDRFRKAGFWVVSIDLSFQMLRLGSRRFPGQYLQADMRSLPFKDSVGGLWVAASLLHIPHADVLVTLQNFYRFLQPGGLIYLSLKSGKDGGWNDAPYQLPRYFAYHQSDRLDKLLKTAGFYLIEGWEAESTATKWLIRFGRKAQVGEPNCRLQLMTSSPTEQHSFGSGNS